MCPVCTPHGQFVVFPLCSEKIPFMCPCAYPLILLTYFIFLYWDWACVCPLGTISKIVTVSCVLLPKAWMDTRAEGKRCIIMCVHVVRWWWWWCCRKRCSGKMAAVCMLSLTSGLNDEPSFLQSLVVSCLGTTCRQAVPYGGCSDADGVPARFLVVLSAATCFDSTHHWSLSSSPSPLYSLSLYCVFTLILD